MDGFLEEGKGDRLFNLLQSLTFEANFFKRLQALEVIFGMVDDSMGKKVNIDSFKEFLIEYTEDKPFMRKVRMVSTMEDTPETCLELYGFDYISSPDFTFDEEFMHKRRIVEKEINNFIGRLMKESVEEEDLLGFDGEDEEDDK